MLGNNVQVKFVSDKYTQSRIILVIFEIQYFLSVNQITKSKLTVLESDLYNMRCFNKTEVFDELSVPRCAD